MNPCFSPANLKAFEPTMKPYYDRFILGIQQTANRNDGIVEMSGRFYNLLLDVRLPFNATELAYGGHDSWYRYRRP